MSAKLTPMMEQYLEVKKQNPGCLLFFRLGDFYEMFFEDAITASRELEITLTGRACGQEERAPMCGVPYHSAEGYIQRLVEKGYKVAICEQVEDPKLAKGLVKREITRIATPGTNMNVEAVQQNRNNYIVSVVQNENRIALAAADVTTGEFLVTEFSEVDKLTDEMARFQPRELLVSENLLALKKEYFDRLREMYGVFINAYEPHHYQYDRCKEILLKHFGMMSLDGLGLDEMAQSVIASGALLEYLQDTQKRDLTNISAIEIYSLQQYMMLDAATRRNLELTETMRDKNHRGSLLWILDHTRTAMGGRMLRKWLEQPLIAKDPIEQRQEAVEEIVNDPMLSEELKEQLSDIYDMERLMGKISFGSVNARDMLALLGSLGRLPVVKEILEGCSSRILQELSQELDPLEDLWQLLDASIYEEPPLTIREGHIIKTGYNADVDRLRGASEEGQTWLMDLENREKEKTGIKNLKVGYNRVFGYYIEVSKSNMSMVPEHYIRKQTLANGERYITEELKGIEDTLLGAKDRVVELEYQLFTEIRQHLASQMVRIQKTADQIAEIDALRSMAESAYRNGYVRPQMLETGTGILEIRDGRHPVVEKMLGEAPFIPNDTMLDLKDQRIAIITGPNMAGKSTYMRQVAVIQLMAQIGSFVPAVSARMSIVDRIFTRVGASDDLARGQSTFMVEMSEVSNILRNATDRSLLILDEIGRGTSTFDGLSIAWAVVEFISNKKVLGARTLFATHYHELTELEGRLEGVKNYCVAIKENGDDVIFLRKIFEGSGDQSYGIEVAKLAGLPETVVSRAREILAELLGQDIAKRAGQIQVPTASGTETAPQSVPTPQPAAKTRTSKKVIQDQMSLFGGLSDKEQALIDSIRSMEVLSMTPMEAMNALYRLKQQAEEL